MGQLSHLRDEIRRRMSEREVFLFPQPNVVWFPKTQMSRYVFEPRYRAMVAEAEKKRIPIALVQLKPGWEAAPKLVPPVYQYCTFGRFLSLERYLDGRYSMVLHGEHRARILEESLSDKGFRRAWVKIDDIQMNVKPAQAQRMRSAVLHSIGRHFSEDALSLLYGMKYQMENTIDGLLYQLIHHTYFEADYKQELLEQPSITRLYHEVFRLLRSLRHPQLSTRKLQPFPYWYFPEN